MYTIRKLQPADIEDVLLILLKLQENMLNIGLESWNKAALQAYVGGGLGLWGKDQVLQGFLLSHTNSSAAELLLLATSPAYQGQGVARYLMRDWLNTCQKPVWLEVHEANLRAKNLYFSLGFQEVGRRPRYYRDGGAAISMTFSA